MVRKLPKRLYRYGPMHEPEHLRQVLLEDKLYCCDPFKFNDPFDCRPRVIVGQSAAERQQAEASIKETLKRNFPEMSSTELEEGAKRTLRLLLTQQIDLTGGYESILKQSGVCCFAESHTNILMWSHYADRHRGYCLEFSTELPESFFKEMAFPIQYQMEYLTVSFFIGRQDDDELGRKALLTKALDWKYEREWRVVSKEPGPVSFPPHLLTGIILGCKIAQQHEYKIRSWIAERDRPIVVKKALMSETEFKLKIAES